MHNPTIYSMIQCFHHKFSPPPPGEQECMETKGNAMYTLTSANFTQRTYFLLATRWQQTKTIQNFTGMFPELLLWVETRILKGSAGISNPTKKMIL